MNEETRTLLAQATLRTELARGLLHEAHTLLQQARKSADRPSLLDAACMLERALDDVTECDQHVQDAEAA